MYSYIPISIFICITCTYYNILPKIDIMKMYKVMYNYICVPDGYTQTYTYE